MRSDEYEQISGEKKVTESLFKENGIYGTTSSPNIRPAVCILDFCFNSTTYHEQIIFVFTVFLAPVVYHWKTRTTYSVLKGTH